MVTRVRSRANSELAKDLRVNPGGNPDVQFNWVSSSGSVQDEVAPGDSHPFTVVEAFREGGVANGKTHPTATLGRNLMNWPLGYTGHNPPSSHLSISSPSNSEYALRVLKGTNPSRAYADLAVSAIELREIPGLIKESYKGILNKMPKWVRRSAKLNLAIQFGLMPMIDDLRKSLEFQTRVNERVKEIERLRTRGLRRTITMDKLSAHSDLPSTTSLNSVYFTYRNTVNIRSTLTVSGHVRWFVSSDNFTTSDEETWQKACDIIMGTHMDFQTVYELLPWSWLVDWFSNLGDFVAANRNVLSAHHTAPLIMREQKTTRSFAGTTAGYSVVVTPYRDFYHTKSRAPAVPTLSASVPFLTERQTSILGSLAIVKSGFKY